ncbi:hypothetical protein P43SY_004711 [Pythium insidiosum]|uniref:Uncharacterized protein n=1 Tax=Pythium insidiosum TaxID=114742 RepID=A0AAD5L9P6_PYTIN|nr:hypothetical protein P43SY_004711 [Pythium insidiosum]
MTSTDDAALTIEQRLERMLTHPRRRQRGQVPMDQVAIALQYQREYVPTFATFDADRVSDCSESLERMRHEKREAREGREMTWEDNLAATLRDEEARRHAATAKRLAQESAMLAQLKTPRDKWKMAVELKLCEFLGHAMAAATPSERLEFLATRVNSSGHTPLHRACRTRHAAMVALLLVYGADVTTRDNQGKVRWLAFSRFVSVPVPSHLCRELIVHQTAFHVAVEHRATEVFTGLRQHVLTYGDQGAALLLAADSDNNSILHWAAASGHAATLSLALEAIGPDEATHLINQQTTRERATAIHLSAARGHIECLDALLRVNGRRTDLRDSSGRNALHLALQQTFDIDRLTRVFLDAKRMPDDDDTFQALEDRSGFNALHIAVLKGFTAVSLALIKGSHTHLDASTRDGAWSPLHLAVMTEDLAIVQALLDAGVLVDSIDNDGQTPLTMACLGGRLELIRLLLRAGANPAHQNKQAHSPLHYLSAFCRDRELLVELLSRGADVNAKTLKLNTPLHFAAMSGNAVATAVLLEHGANPNEINEDKRSVVYLAKKWRHREVEDLVKPPEEASNESNGHRPRSGGDARTHIRRHHFAAHRADGGEGRFSAADFGKRSVGSPFSSRSEDSDSDDVATWEDDEEILEPSSPWPVQQENNPTTRRSRSFAELGARLMSPHDGEPATEKAGRRLRPVVLPHQTKQHSAELQAARQLLDGASPVTNAQLTRHTHRFLAQPVHIPWEMTVPVTLARDGLSERLAASTSDSDLQRKLKPSIRAHLGLLRDHLTHAQHLAWPRYANKRVFRKDPALP